MAALVLAVAAAQWAAALVPPASTPRVWGGPARGTVMGPSGFLFAFSGADGPTKEGSGFCGLHANSTPPEFTFDFAGGGASLTLNASLGAAAAPVVVTAATSDVLAAAAAPGDGQPAVAVLAYAAWDLLVGYGPRPGAATLSASAALGGASAGAAPAAADGACNLTGAWEHGSSKRYAIAEDPAAGFVATAAAGSWRKAHGTVAPTGSVTISFDNGFSDVGTVSPGCSAITWTRHPGQWTRAAPPPPPPSPPPPGVRCTSAGVMTMCQAASGRAFAVAYGPNATAAAGAAAATLTTDDVDTVATKRLAPLGALPPPRMSGQRYDTLARKVYSTMRANTLAPEGITPVHWSTPDKTPHKGMWLWDSCFHAIGRAVVEPELAWEFLDAMLRASAPDGHVPIEAQPWSGQLSGDTQPPLLALATAYVRSAGGVNDSALAWALPRLERYVMWDYTNRDKDGDGLLEWNHGTESGLDNSPLWDGAASNTLASTDFSVYASLECSMIAALHRELGNSTAAAEWAERANRTASTIHSQLWDDQDGFYYYRKLSTEEGGGLGPFVRTMTPSGFAPLLLGGVDDARVAALVAKSHDASLFATAQPLPTVTPGASFSTNMWRGPAWTNTNLFAILGLRRYAHVPGAAAAADALQAATVEMVRRAYEEYGTTFEFYDSKDQVPPTRLERKSSPDSGGVRDYHWTAANTFWMLHNPNGTLPVLGGGRA